MKTDSFISKSEIQYIEQNLRSMKAKASPSAIARPVEVEGYNRKESGQ